MTRALVAALAALALAGARATAGPASDPELLAAARATLASEIEPGQPATPIEAWLVALVGAPASVAWSLDDCGEQTGDPRVDAARDLPVCGTLAARLAADRSVSLSFLVGTRRRGVVEGRGFYWAAVIEGDRTRHVRSLAELARHLRERSR